MPILVYCYGYAVLDVDWFPCWLVPRNSEHYYWFCGRSQTITLPLSGIAAVPLLTPPPPRYALCLLRLYAGDVLHCLYLHLITDLFEPRLWFDIVFLLFLHIPHWTAC